MKDKSISFFRLLILLHVIFKIENQFVCYVFNMVPLRKLYSSNELKNVIFSAKSSLEGGSVLDIEFNVVFLNNSWSSYLDDKDVIKDPSFLYNVMNAIGKVHQ